MTSFRVYGGRRVLGAAAGVTSLYRPRVFHAAQPEGGWGTKTLCGKHFLGELQESSRQWEDLAATQQCSRCVAELIRLLRPRESTTVASISSWQARARVR